MSQPLRRALAARIRRTAGRCVHRGWELARKYGEISPASPAGRRFGRLGPGSCIAFPPGAIFGEPWIHIGAGTLIGAHVTMSAGMAPGLDLGPEPLLRIGDRCSIGRGGHVVAHQSIEIGDDVLAGPYVYITDQNHGYADPTVPIGRQWPVNDPVVIGAGCWLGTGAVILPGARLGPNVVVAAGAVVRGAFPGHCVVAGVPARIVRRFDPVAGWCAPPADPLSGDAVRGEAVLPESDAVLDGGTIDDAVLDDGVLDDAVLGRPVPLGGSG